MIRKTFVAAALVAGLVSGSAMAAPKHTTKHSVSTKHTKMTKRSSGSTAERDATRKLNEQQLASAGGMSGMQSGTAPMASPAGPAPMAAPMAPNAPAPGMTPPVANTPPTDPAPPAPPQL